jgi:hypothetical protein
MSCQHDTVTDAGSVDSRGLGGMRAQRVGAAAVAAVMLTLGGSQVAYSASGWKGVAAASAKNVDSYSSVSANGTTKADPTEVRFKVAHSHNERIELSWDVYCSDRNFNSWSRSGTVKKRTPFTKTVDTPNRMHRCDVDFYASSFDDGKLSVKSQSNH